MNLRECISFIPLPGVNQAAHSGFETQRRCHQKSETGVSVVPKMDMCLPKILKKKKKEALFHWGKETNWFFQGIKLIILKAAETPLRHHDRTQPVTVQAGASQRGLGSMSHVG